MKNIFSCLTLLAFVFLAGTAEAEEISLKKTLLGLKKVPIEYGIHDFKLGDIPLSIVRAELPSEVAGYGDVYTVLYQREGKWFLVQYPNHTFNAIAWPHTEEDAISAIGFFTDQNESFEYPGAFYLLSVYKAFEKSVPKAGVITFELYKLQKNADFDFIEFHEIGTLKTGKKYSNVDCAIESELGLSSLNGNDVNSACTKR